MVAAAALPAAYQLFRMGYFAAVVPNTAIAKEAGAARWDQGWRYLADFAGVYWLWIPLAALLGWWVCRLAHLVALARCPEQPGAAKVSSAAWRRFLGSRRSGARAHRTGEGLPPTRTRAHAAFLIVPVVCGLAHAAYVVRLGGDFMHGRMLLPSLFALTLPAALVVGTRWWHVALPALVVVPWAVASMLWFRPPYRGLAPGGVAGIGPQGIADERAFYVTFSRQTHPVTLADYGAAWWAQHGHALRTLAESAEHERRRVVLPVRDALPAVSPGQPDQPGTPGRPAAAELPLAPSAKADLVVHRNNVGLTAYAAGPRVHVVDHLGLGDPLAARLRLERRARPGHEKGLPNEWVAARFGAPDAPVPAVPAAAPRASLDPAAAAAARAALACGDLAELLRSIEAPLTPERFLRNVALAWRLTRLRIPADPHQARAELCRAQP